uniref:serine hydrolase domain-containing protein n=1 Tax=Sandarakinorhabdus limnophila TaxID=210512 RepID=UPI0026F0450F|nr:serine hydrolase domain-containing protein [Sandarakinorhabdus limnophila]
MKSLLKTLVLAAALAAGPVAAAAPVAAPAAGPVAAPAATPGLERLTAGDAEAWLDGYMPYALRRGGIAGAVVVIVKDGQVLVEKGYGVSDTATNAPVDPKKTLFRPGSVSKLFTWTAVMQQVEAGKIDLDADINRYIDFKIPPRDGKPVTMRNILTHTTGFEETAKGLIVIEPKNLPTLEHELKKWVPTRIFAPGTIPAYSNYGAALAGYVVQRVSGEPFDAYVESHIFKPLGMADSTFRQPLPAALAPQMSKGYDSADGKAKTFELVPMGPAGSLSASGDDMGKFMIAHLSQGGPLMKPATTRLMHDTSFALLAPIDGMALGFFEEKINNVRGVGHGGDTGVFHSHLNLWPNEGVGLYVSLNSAGREGASGGIRQYLYEGFADRYLPGNRTFPGLPAVDKKTAAEHAALMASTNYIMGRGAFTSFLSAGALASQVKFIVNDDGTISPDLLKDMSGAPRRYREIAPFLWQQVGGHGFLKANVVDGKVALWSISEFSGAITLIPVEPAKSARLLYPLLGLGVFVLLATLLAWPATALMRRHYGTAFPLSGPRAAGYRLSRLFVVLAFVALAGWTFLVVKISAGLEGFAWLADHDGTLRLVEGLTLVAFVGGLVVALWNAWLVWTKGGGWFARLWSLLLVVAFAAFLWTFHAYAMINFSTDY